MADYVVLLKATPEVRMLNDLRLRDGQPDLSTAPFHASFFDSYALEAAVCQKERENTGGQVITVTVGDAALAEQHIRKALACGADRAVLVSDPALKSQAVGDSGLVARVLAAAIQKKAPNFGLIFCGSQSEDAYAGCIGPMVAEYLGIPQLTFVDKLDIGKDSLTAERSREGGSERVTMPRGPVLLSVTNSLKEPRFANIMGIQKARTKPLEKLTLADLGMTAAPRVQVSYAPPPARQDPCQYLGSGLTYESLAERVRKVTGA
jgi:electron transfer flavoprotein beta subunit